MSDLVKVNVDGVEVEVAPGTTILQACEVAGAPGEAWSDCWSQSAAGV